jgi:hypothetical protein
MAEKFNLEKDMLAYCKGIECKHRQNEIAIECKMACLAYDMIKYLHEHGYSIVKFPTPFAEEK